MNLAIALRHDIMRVPAILLLLSLMAALSAAKSDRSQKTNNENKSNPTTARRSQKDKLSTLSPVTLSTTDDSKFAIYSNPTMSPINKEKLPTCPLPYNPIKTYEASDTIEMNNHIFICKQSPYEEYCNVANVDHNWNSTQREYWDNAWELVGPCEMRVVTPATKEPSQSPTEPMTLPSCPPPYDHTQNTYVAGDIITNNLQIFQCQSYPYEEYCNSFTVDKEWNATQREWWEGAWLHVGPCEIRMEDDGAEETVEPSLQSSVKPSVQSSEVPSIVKSAKPSVGTSSSPSISDSTSPSVQPSYKPTIKPTNSPSISPTETITLPVCPQTYDDTETSYVAGDTVEINSHIYVCQSYPYEEYCNVHRVDRFWTTEQKSLWDNAWLHLGECNLQSEAPTNSPTNNPTISPSASPTNAPTPLPSTSPTNEPTPLLYCPPTYDKSKTDYVAGDQVEISMIIYECAGGRDKDKVHIYEPYCNIADKSQLSGNETELELWDEAWTQVSACYQTESPTGAPTEFPTPLQYCPPAYDLSETQYKAGDQVEINLHIFECAGGQDEAEKYKFVPYCNIVNDSELADDEKELWYEAWKPIHKCYRTETPTFMPSKQPSVKPTKRPTFSPSSTPTYEPSKGPTNRPTKRPTLAPSSTPTISPSKRPTNTPSKAPSNSPTREPTNKPSAKPSLSPTTMRPTTRSPISEMWWPDVESEEKTCYYGRDYPEFMTLNSNRLNFLFTSKEECCRAHSCVVSTKADYWWPALESDEKQCSYGSEYPDWMSLNSNMNNFLFTTKEECCQKHKCTKSEFWWPDVESSENKCNYSTGYPDWMSLSSNTANYLFTSEQACCARHECTKTEFWYPDVLASSEHQCKYGKDFPTWMSIPTNVPHYLFETQQECCLKHDCQLMQWYPEIYTSEKKCLLGIDFPHWMTFRSNHYLFESEEDCCAVHECEEQYWYPDLLTNNGKRNCIRDSDFPAWMESEINKPIFLFDSKEGCCAKHGCNDLANQDPDPRWGMTPTPTTKRPTRRPSLRPSQQPTQRPSPKPSKEPTNTPSSHPTPTPTLPPEQVPVCPNRYDSSIASSYKAGSQVEVNAVIYQCKGSLFSYYCSSPNYQPSTTTTLWTQVWEDLGPCSLNGRK